MTQTDLIPQEKSNLETRRFYWLKLRKDFFQSHKIRILENMPNGIHYLVFYLKLLTESISHSGNLRFSEAITYTDEMLSGVTKTNIDIVRVGLKVLQDLELLEYHEDGTIFLPESIEMIGSESEAAERMRRLREERKKTEHSRTLFGNVTDVFSPPTTPPRETRVYIQDKRDKENRDLDLDLDLNGLTGINRDKPTSGRSGNPQVASLMARLFENEYLKHPDDDADLYRYQNLFTDLLGTFEISNVNQSLKYTLKFSRTTKIDDKYNWLYVSLLDNCERFANGEEASA